MECHAFTRIPPRVFHMYSDRTVYSSVRFIRLSCARRPAHILLIYAYAEPLTHSHAARGLIGSHHCVVPARTFLISHLTTFNYIERRRSECRAELGGVRCSVFCALVAMMLCHGALLFTPTTAATVCSRNSVTVARHTRTHSRNITQTQP